MKVTATNGLCAHVSTLPLGPGEARETFLNSTPCFSLTLYHTVSVASISGRGWNAGVLL